MQGSVDMHNILAIYKKIYTYVIATNKFWIYVSFSSISKIYKY